MSTTPQINVTVIPERHSRMLLAGIQKAWMPAFAGMTSVDWTPDYVAL